MGEVISINRAHRVLSFVARDPHARRLVSELVAAFIRFHRYAARELGNVSVLESVGATAAMMEGESCL